MAAAAFHRAMRRFSREESKPMNKDELKEKADNLKEHGKDAAGDVKKKAEGFGDRLRETVREKTEKTDDSVKRDTPREDEDE
jgi:hypothetical protein